MFKIYPGLISAVIVKGELPFSHWSTVLAPDNSIPVVAVDPSEFIADGAPIFLDTLNYIVRANLSADDLERLRHELIETCTRCGKP